MEFAVHRISQVSIVIICCKNDCHLSFVICHLSVTALQCINP